MTPLARLRVCLCAILFFCLENLSAASTNSAWSLQTWQSDDGLPNNDVSGLVQASDGYLWISTWSDLARFDGVCFDKFSAKNFAGLPGKITALLDTTNGLWMGMDHGAIIFLNGASAQVFTNGLSDRIVQSLTTDSDGTLWITYRGGAAYSLKNGKAKLLTADDGFPVTGYTSSFARDTQGHIWFARGTSLGIVRAGRFVTVNTLPGKTMRLTACSSGGIWICVGSSLMRCDIGGQLANAKIFAGGRADLEPTALLEDDAGGVWIGTSDSGLFYFDGANFESVATSHRSISALAADNEGNIWVGTLGGGLDRVHPRAITLQNTETGLPFETIQSLCEDTNGAIWTATANGLLMRSRNNHWTIVSTNADWPGGRATCVASGTNGDVWIGTMDHALYCWRDGRFIQSFGRNELGAHTVRTLLISRTGDVWIGEESPDIVQRWHDGKLETFQMPAGIRVIRAMAEDPDGNIWVGSSRGFLVRIQDGKVIDETARLGAEYLSIRALHVTADGSLWIAFADEGLGLLRNNHFIHVTANDGLCDDNLSQLSDDGRWLWCSGDHGIFKILQNDLLDFADGKTKSIRCVRYGSGKGLQSLQGNFGESPDTLRSRDGRVWIPTRSALVVIDPKKLREDSQPPKVILKRVTVDGEDVGRYGGAMPMNTRIDLPESNARLELPPRHRRLEFEFTALNFTAPENVHFRYRLEGFDERWIETSSPRIANYTRLPAGHYVFRVKACNADGIWNESGASFAFTVAPFFWQTWWFRCIAFLIFTLIVIRIVRYVSFRRLRSKLQLLEQQAALDRERARIARDLHDDIGTRLTKIILLTGLAQRDISKPEKAGEHVEKISTTARRVVKSLDETVWAVNPRNDNLPHLISYIGQFAVEFLQTADIRCRADLPEHPPHHGVPAKTRHNLFLAVKEALNNIVRHSNAGEVQLRISADEQLLNVMLEDDGRGIGKLENNGCADGLQNMRKRMEEIGGEFKFESAPGNGTRISFVCPWRNGD